MNTKNRLLIIISIVIAAALSILIFASAYNPKIKPSEMITPTPAPITPEPTPTPTPKIEILENYEHGTILYAEFYQLFNVMTTSQYNYAMISVDSFFNALYQANLRSYSFEQFKSSNVDLFYDRFSYDNYSELTIPFDKFTDAFADADQEYVLILNKDTLVETDEYYEFTVTLYIDGEIATTFDFSINKENMKIIIQ